MPTPILDYDAKQLVTTGGARQHTAANNELLAGSDISIAGAAEFGIWAYFDTTPADPDSLFLISAWDSDPNNIFILAIANQGGALKWRLQFSEDGTAASFLETTTPSIEAGRWYFVSGGYDGANMFLQIDNGTPVTVSSSGFAASAQASVYIGGIQSNLTLNTMDGRLSKAFVCTSRQLSSAERTYLYNSGNGRTAAELGISGTDGEDLAAVLYDHWNLGEAAGDATGNLNGNVLSDTNTVTAANGPSAVNAADESSNANHGILTGFTASQAITSWKRDTGRLGLDESANDFHLSIVGNSVDIYTADVPDTIGSGSAWRLQRANAEWGKATKAHSITALPVTISAWVRTTSTSASIIASTNGELNATNHYGAWLQVQPSGELACSYGDGSSTGATGRRTKVATTPLNDGDWHHVMAVIRGATDMDLFLDGSDDGGSYSGTGGSIAHSEPNLAIGQKSTSGSATYCDALLDEIRIYDSDESANVSTLAAGGDVAGYLARYSFDEGPADGLALAFDGTDDYIDFGDVDAAPFDGASDKITVACFAKFDALGSTQALLQKFNANTNERVISFSTPTSTGNIRFVYYSGGNTNWKFADTDATVEAGRWYHIAATADLATAEIKIYLNGVNQSVTPTVNGTPPTTLPDHGSKLRFGALRESGGLASFFDGIGDGLRLYNEVLSASQIMELAEGGDPTGASAPAGHWKLDDGPQNTPGDGDPVLSWTDRQSGKRAVQETAAKRWSYTPEDADFKNDWASLTADGIDDLMRLGESFLGGQAGTVVMAVKVTGTGAEQQIVAVSDEASSTEWIGFGVDTANNLEIHDKQGGGNNQVEGSTTVAGSGSSHIVTITSNGSSWSLRVDGNDETENVVVGSNTGDWFGDISGVDNLTIGALKHTSETEHFAGKVARIQVYEGELTAAEIQAAENQLLVPDGASRTLDHAQLRPLLR